MSVQILTNVRMSMIFIVQFWESIILNTIVYKFTLKNFLQYSYSNKSPQHNSALHSMSKRNPQHNFNSVWEGRGESLRWEVSRCAGSRVELTAALCVARKQQRRGERRLALRGAAAVTSCRPALLHHFPAHVRRSPRRLRVVRWRRWEGAVLGAGHCWWRSTQSLDAVRVSGGDGNRAGPWIVVLLLTCFFRASGCNGCLRAPTARTAAPARSGATITGARARQFAYGRGARTSRRFNGLRGLLREAQPKRRVRAQDVRAAVHAPVAAVHVAYDQQPERRAASHAAHHKHCSSMKQ